MSEPLLDYTLIIEEDEAGRFRFSSPDLAGFQGKGFSLEDCLQQAPMAIEEHLAELEALNCPIPSKSSDPQIIFRGETWQSLA